MKKYLTLCSSALLLFFALSCEKVDDNNLNNSGAPYIEGLFKEHIPATINATPSDVRILYATENKAIFSTLYDNGKLEIRVISNTANIDKLISPEELSSFNFKRNDGGLEELYTIDTDGNFYTVLSNLNQPELKTVWKYDILTKTTIPFTNVINGNLTKISFWPQQNKLLVQDTNTVYTLNLDTTNSSLEFLIGGPNNSLSQPKDGTGVEASVDLKFPLSTFDNKFFYLEDNRYLREVSLTESTASVKTISMFESNTYNNLKMKDESNFYINRRNPDIGLSEGDFKTQQIKSFFFMSSRYYGYPIRFFNGLSEEILVHHALYEVLGGMFDNKKLTKIKSYYPVDELFWGADEQHIVLISKLNTQINNTRRIKL